MAEGVSNRGRSSGAAVGFVLVVVLGTGCGLMTANIGPLGDAGEPGVPTADAGTRADGGAADAAFVEPDAGVMDDGGTSSGRTGLFVAQGDLGRTVVSCDLGLTWREDRSEEPGLRCFEAAPDGGVTDCNHSSGAARGLAWGNGWFVATYGWGYGGSLRRSRDGVQWERVQEGETFGGLLFGDGTFMAASRAPQVSSDDGATWRPAAAPELNAWNVRRGGFGGSTGVFVLFASDGAPRDWAISADRGASWTRPQSVPAACAVDQWAGGIVSGAGVLVAMDGTTSCRSADDGKTWSQVPLGGTIESRLVWTGSEFMAWGFDAATGKRAVFRSTHGASWTRTPTQTRSESGTTDGPFLSAVAWGAGTFVGVNGWGEWYDKQRFFRSTDGVTWDRLPASAFTGGHPIQNIVYGEGERSAACP